MVLGQRGIGKDIAKALVLHGAEPDAHWESFTNAISGIIVVGAMTQLASDSMLVKIVAFVAVLLASINVFGGFTVTARMLNMFKKG